MFVIDLKSYAKPIEEDGKIIRYQIRPAMIKWVKENLHEVMYQGGLHPTITIAHQKDRDAFVIKYPKAK